MPIPSVVKRPMKNINGDIVTDFTLTQFDSIRISGIVFEVDLATDDYKKKIGSHSKMLLDHIDESINSSCYVVYSDCEPNSTRFKVLCGIPQDIGLDHPFYFTVDIPQLFCAKFNYSGDLLDIGDVLKTDFARFLKISNRKQRIHISNSYKFLIPSTGLIPLITSIHRSRSFRLIQIFNYSYCSFLYHLVKE